MTVAEPTPLRSRQRMLLIAYHFPPSAAVGGMRAANFARSLATFGWDPHVLTIRDRDVYQLDPDRRQGLDGVAVHHARVLPTLELTYARWRQRGSRPTESSRPSASSAGTPARNGAPVREAPIAQLKRYILSFLALPDRERGWVIPATTTAVRTMRRHRIEWFMTSCPPYTVHVIGLLVKTLTGKRWVADFRDPWMTTGSKRLFPTCRLSIAVESWLEKKVMEHADLVLFNVERLRDAYRARYRHVSGEKFAFIPNAVTPWRRSEIDVPTKYEQFTLSYTGSLYVGRSPEPVFAAVARLVATGSIAPDALRILLVGQCQEINGVPVTEVARRHGLERSVEVRGAVPHEQAMEIVRRSHLALLLAPNLPFQIPAKVYDYLAAGTRILAIAEDGGTADLIRDTSSGRAFSPEDIAGIAEYILAEVTRRSAQARVERAERAEREEHRASLRRFDIRLLTEELVGHLGRVGALNGAAR